MMIFCAMASFTPKRSVVVAKVGASRAVSRFSPRASSTSPRAYRSIFWRQASFTLL